MLVVVVRAMLVCIALAVLSPGSPGAQAQDAGDPTRCRVRPTISIGGVTGFGALADPDATTRLRASCKVGLYIHAEAWVRIGDEVRSRILANFAGNGPGLVELGYNRTPRGYMRDFYGPTFLAKGVHADTALVNGLCQDGVDGAMAYVGEARAVGLATVAPVFAPNTGQYRLGGFDAPAFDCVRQTAKAGGALAIDAPPHVFLALPDDYRQFVASEVRWANAQRVRSVFIVSPDGSGRAFAEETDRMLQALEAAGATPTDLVFETYDMQRGDAANRVGRESDTQGIAATLLRMLPRLTR